MDNVEISFTKKELELLEALVGDYINSLDSLDSNTIDTLDEPLIAKNCYKKIQKATRTPCLLVSFCQSRTAPCFVMEPDDGCPYYRYFKDLIERREGDKNE